ncbi:cell division protein FtsL [Aestuariibius sp. HNIBRBA575]|uniref:cell division protein FtsL n=1 Tax=Aestuariibius sp. HNIBRBA575 TaxID=3233343 RepID=UPI0034A26B33
MRSVFYVFSALAVIGLAYWAYNENYRTQASLKDVRGLHRDIGAAHERLAILRAEWAYLNRPDRLRDLAELNFERLELMELMPDAFGQLDQVSFPLAPIVPIEGGVMVSSDNAEVDPL